MYPVLQVPVSYAGILSMIIAAGTIVSSLQSDRLTRWLGTGKVTVILIFSLPLWKGRSETVEQYGEEAAAKALSLQKVVQIRG